MNDKAFTPGEIPFMILLQGGTCCRVPLHFENGIEILIYKPMCMDKEENIWCFRTKSDGKLAAKMNGWKLYVG